MPRPKTGGRKKGSPNKKTLEIAKKVEESGLTPLQLMLNTLRDEGIPLDMRLDAAKSAAPYVHSKMPQAHEIKQETIVRDITDKPLTDDEWEGQYS